ncbi:MAG: response regulator transcription factor [Dongiaceae bacterium]
MTGNDIGEGNSKVGVERKVHLLVVDDDKDIQATVRDYFELHGFSVRTAGDGDTMRQLLAVQPVDVILMDLQLPGEDGLALTRELRAKSGMGIVIVTGTDETIDRVVGLEVGADDYVGKPFDLRELLARVKSVLRRTRPGPVTAAPMEIAQSPAAGEEVRIGQCTLNLASRQLYDADGNEIPLRSMEFDLLEAFAANPHRVLSRARLLDLAHSHGEDVFDRSIDVRITRLRKKIEVNPDQPEILKTVRGAGYMFVPPGKS